MRSAESKCEFSHGLLDFLWQRAVRSPYSLWIDTGEGKIMTASAMRRRMMVLVLGASVLLLGGCVSPPGTYPDPNGPRDAKGHLVDPQTGLLLPGENDGGI
jgi:hypothetical protein